MTCEFQFGLDTFTLAGGGFQNLLFQIPVSSSTPGGTYTFNIVSTDGQTILTSPQTIQVVVPPPPMPAVSFSSTSVSFPSVLVGSTQMQTVLLTNTGAATLDITGITIPSGANAFTESNTCGPTLAANATCTITVALNAKSVSSPTGSLSVADNATGSPQTVSLSASVGDLTIQPAAGAATSITVPAGTPAVFSLQVAPNNYGAGVGIGCTGTISLGTCTVQPASINLSGPNTPAAFQVTVTSTAATGAAFIPSRRQRNKLPLVLSLAFLVLLAAAAAATLAGTTWARLPARCARVAAPLLAAALLLASWGCGGGGSSGGGGGTGPGGGGGNSGTPPGSYTLTVTANAGGALRSFQITVVVQ